MENKVTIYESDLSESAKGLIRYSFNPSGNETVNRIKLLACALMTEYEKIAETPLTALPANEEYLWGRNREFEAANAITFLQTASMWAVLGATKGK